MSPAYIRLHASTLQQKIVAGDQLTPRTRAKASFFFIPPTHCKPSITESIWTSTQPYQVSRTHTNNKHQARQQQQHSQYQMILSRPRPPFRYRINPSRSCTPFPPCNAVLCTTEQAAEIFISWFLPRSRATRNPHANLIEQFPSMGLFLEGHCAMGLYGVFVFGNYGIIVLCVVHMQILLGHVSSNLSFFVLCPLLPLQLNFTFDIEGVDQNCIVALKSDSNKVFCLVSFIYHLFCLSQKKNGIMEKGNYGAACQTSSLCLISRSQVTTTT